MLNRRVDQFSETMINRLEECRQLRLRIANLREQAIFPLFRRLSHDSLPSNERFFDDGSPIKLIPTSFDLGPNASCNSHCAYCSIWKNKSNDLPLTSIERFIDGVAKYRPTGTRINIVGGEPTLRSDLGTILLLARQSNIEAVITTNGYKLAKDEYTRMLIDSGLSMIVFSLDGFAPTNDRLRIKGGFEKVIRAMKNIRSIDRKVVIGIQTVINAFNCSEIPDFAAWLHENSLADNHTFQALVSDFVGDQSSVWFERHPLWPKDLESVDRAIDRLLAYKQTSAYKIVNSDGQLNFYKEYFRNPNGFRNISRCSIGDFFVSLNDGGEISICPYKPPVGNIAELPLDAIFNGPEARKRRKDISSCRQTCNLLLNCRYEMLGAIDAAGSCPSSS